MKTLARWVLVGFLLVGGLAMSGCNTIEGFGKDIKTLGGSIEKKAEETGGGSE